GTSPAAAVTSADADTASASRPPRLGTGWQRYVQGPASRTVRPVRVLGSTGDVRDPQALLKPGGGATVLRRPQPSPAP
ncbi:hypothetical protein FGX00_00265, partial [Xylella fastidiosa subsp. multiplex]|nr:hypothetical protein [Xylella fastidiosa subsp. multiplex]